MANPKINKVKAYIEEFESDQIPEIRKKWKMRKETSIYKKNGAKI